MLQRPFLSVVRLAAAILVLSTPSLAQKPAAKDPQEQVPAAPVKQSEKLTTLSAEEQVYERAEATVAKLERNTLNRKAFLGGEFLGKPYGPRSEDPRVTQRDLDKTFVDPLNGLAKAKEQLEGTQREMLQKTRSSGDFMRLAYIAVNDAFEAYWTSDFFWPDMMIKVLGVPVQKLDNRLVAERKELVEKSGLTSEQRDNMISELDDQQSQVKKKAFYETAREFRKYMQLVRDDRIMMIQDLWCWQDFADQLSKSSGKTERDTHAKAAADAQQARENYYRGTMGPHRGVFVLAFGYSSPTYPDIYDWFKERPFPDIQGGPNGEYTLYTDHYMQGMTEPSLDSLRPKSCPGAALTPDANPFVKGKNTEVTQGTASGAREGERP
jgi:hypothetical protein